MSEESTMPVAPALDVQSPPPAPMPARDESDNDPRTHLHRLATELMRTHNRRLVVEYLRLRRAMR